MKIEINGSNGEDPYGGTKLVGVLVVVWYVAVVCTMLWLADRYITWPH